MGPTFFVPFFSDLIVIARTDDTNVDEAIFRAMAYGVKRTIDLGLSPHWTIERSEKCAF